MYAYNFGSVSAARFGILIALGFVAFAYIGGITMVSGAVVGGLVATEGLIPYTIEEALNISGNWTLLVGGVILIVTLIQNPEGIAGTTYRKRMAARARQGCCGCGRQGRRRRARRRHAARRTPMLVSASPVNARSSLAGSRCRSVACTPWSTSTSKSVPANSSG